MKEVSTDNQKKMQEDLPNKIRFKFSKTGSYKYFSHLDIISIISRAVRRAGIKVKLSEGFNPKPKISFGPPTPLGIESYAEYGDILLVCDIGPEEFLKRLNSALQDRIKISKALRTGPGVKSIMSQTDLIKYSIHPDNDKIDYFDSLKYYIDQDKEQVSMGIYKVERSKNCNNSNSMVINLFGYAKILKDIESKVFKFGEFKLLLDKLNRKQNIDSLRVTKEELYIFDGEDLITPFETL